MFNSDMLDVAIGLVLVYLLFSLVATAMRESLESWLKSRGVLLEKGILQLLSAPGPAPLGAKVVLPADDERVMKAKAKASSEEALLAAIYRSTPVFSLYQKEYVAPSKRGDGRAGWGKAVHLPAYIPERSFVEGLLEVVHSYGRKDAGGTPESLDRLRLALEAVPNAPVRDAIRSAIRAGNGDPEAVRRYLQIWYSTVMDRVSGWYRRRTQWWVLGGSAVVAIALNINTITIVQRLSENSALRAAIVNSASATANESLNSIETSDALGSTVEHVKSVGLPIGWGPQTLDCPPVKAKPPAGTTGSPPAETWDCSKTLLADPGLNWGYARTISWAVLLSSPGWIMTALAISLGAPFWFDVLNKFMIVRSTVKPHEKSGEEGSKDPTSSNDASKAARPAGEDMANVVPAPRPAPSPPSTATATEHAEIARLEPGERPREDDPTFGDA